MRYLSVVAGLLMSLSFAAPAEAQSLTLQGGITEGSRFSVYSILTGAGAVSSCDYTVKMAATKSALNAGNGKVIYTFTDATQDQLDGAAMISIFKNLTRRPPGKVYVKSTLDCGTFVVDSNTKSFNFSALQGETQVGFAKFIKHLKNHYDSGV